MIPIPTVADLSNFSGRPENSYTSFADSALLQATLQFTIATQITADDWSSGYLAPDDMLLAVNGIIAYADWIYLRQPYHQAIASPLLSETVGSYTYSKPPPVEMRNVQAQELGVTLTGVDLWDMALQYLSKRTRAAGVFFGQVLAFDHEKRDILEGTVLRHNKETGELELLGPGDVDKLDIPPFSVNAEAFPADPGIG